MEQLLELITAGRTRPVEPAVDGCGASRARELHGCRGYRYDRWRVATAALPTVHIDDGRSGPDALAGRCPNAAPATQEHTAADPLTAQPQLRRPAHARQHDRHH